MRRVVVIGAGAAGTMAAIAAASAGARTALVERTADGGRKILISGGGRCNILPARVDERRFVTDSSPNLLRKMMRTWPLREQIAFFESELGLRLVEEQESAKLFPASNKARDVRDGLLSLAARRGATLMMGTLVKGLAPGAAGGWRIEVQPAAPPGTEASAPGGQGAWPHEPSSLQADAVVVATGGLSVPQTGSDGLGLRIVERLGHAVNPTYAALTPLTADPAIFGSLAGVSLPVTLTARADGLKATATGGFLFTHRGYSGPAVLDVSHVAVRSREGGGAPARVVVRWTRLGDAEWEAALRPRGTRPVLAALRAELPERAAIALAEAAGVQPGRPLAGLRRDERLRLIEMLVRGPLPWTGDEGYRKAEVTGGGVALEEIDPRTMESRRHPGLYLCGEMLDAFGPIGGYNFLWAWATGRAAGLGAAGVGGPGDAGAGAVRARRTEPRGRGPRGRRRC